MLDPKTLTPESLYRLQSETWSQGAEFERERIIKDLVLEIKTAKDLHETDCYLSGMEHALLLIKGEQK